MQCSMLKIPPAVTYFGKFAFDCGEVSACLNRDGSGLHTDELAWMHQEMTTEALFPPKHAMKVGINLLIEN